MSALSFDFEFSPGEHGTPEERATTAELRLEVDGEVLTRVDDSWARSVRERVRVSCYPLATWLASSWWRLLHEPAPTHVAPGVAWRMTHDLRTVGGGYLWPNVSFWPDGETVDLVSRPSPPAPGEPLRFLSAHRAGIGVGELERTLAAFVNSVLARLSALGIAGTELELLWADVDAERSDERLARFRRAEALLGYDPDDGNEAFIEALLERASSIGPGALAELVASLGVARSRQAPADFLRSVDASVASAGLLVSPQVAAFEGPETAERGLRPWIRGRNMAAHVRQAMGLARGPVSDEALKALLGADFTRSAANSPLGVLVRRADGPAHLHLRRSAPTARRFEVARYLGEWALAPATDRWLIASDAGTARQKAQRAFAAEFLVPILELRERLEGVFSQEEIEAAATHYGVSPLLVASHLANHGLLSAEEVGRAVIAA
jgi:hypothetical protein